MPRIPRAWLLLAAMGAGCTFGDTPTRADCGGFQCQLSQSECVGTQVRHCTVGAGGCVVWGAPEDCGPGNTCSGDRCVNAAGGPCLSGQACGYEVHDYRSVCCGGYVGYGAPFPTLTQCLDACEGYVALYSLTGYACVQTGLAECRQPTSTWLACGPANGAEEVAGGCRVGSAPPVPCACR
jgi:hypothetical protein